MLDKETINTIKATLPVLEQTGPRLTAYFYERMFHHNPELKDIFNLSNQENGAQRQALFDAICAYAANIENLSALLPAVERIAQKHASFTIAPEQYSIVGHHLLATIDELLSPGQPVLDAWGKAYNLLADIFIKRESDIYQDTAQKTGGWKGTRPFNVVKKQKQSDVITSFELEPADGGAVADFTPGQYLAVYLRHPDFDYQEIRQYSLTHTPNGKSYRIAVKQEPKGKVSGALHNGINPGDQLLIAPPYGDFVLDTKPDAPVFLISAGVGQTPLLSMLHALAQKQHSAPVYWLHAAQSKAVHAFEDEVNQTGKHLPQFTQHIWYENNADTPQAHYHTGLMQFSDLKDAVKLPGAQFYFCGPVAFMASVAEQLIAFGIAPEQLHYECFGPHKII